MISIDAFEKEHQSLIFRHSHSVQDTLLLVTLCVSYLLPLIERVILGDRPDIYADRLEQDLQRIKLTMDMISIPHVCPQCGLMSDWRLISLPTVLDVSWVIASTRVAMGCDPLVSDCMPIFEIKQTLKTGCPIFIEFSCKGCRYSTTGYIKLGKIELIKGESEDLPP